MNQTIFFPIKHQDPMIQDSYSISLQWVAERSDYFLSPYECCEACGINPNVFLDRLDLG